MNDLNDGIRQSGMVTSVVAMNDGVNKYNYPADVAFEIEQNEITSYINAANYLNTHHFDAAILQHEFGIYGGPDGRHILQLLKRLQIPVITTLHTILDDPSEGQRMVINEIAGQSEKIISISKKGIDILEEAYGIPTCKCAHIHHGVHRAETEGLEEMKQELGVKDKKILLTFGLLSRNKSIEVVINALPDVLEKHPDVVYIILGATHPHVIKHEGEAYRHALHRLVDKLQLQEHVVFINRFVSNENLLRFLSLCDIYVIPYLGRKQISSGTLIYAMGAGKPVVSTPFWYAEEMLAEGRGLLFDFNDSGQLSEKIIGLLDNETERETISRKALALAEQCYWPGIGKQYITLLHRLVLAGRATASAPVAARTKARMSTRTSFRPAASTATDSEGGISMPPFDLGQIRRLTDCTGLLQHARYTIPDRVHGYCIDDNARALMLCVMLQNEAEDQEELQRLSSIYLSFIDYAYNPAKGKFRNFMSYERRWQEEEGSEDSTGRTIWALGYTTAYTRISNFYHHADYLFRKGLETIDCISHPRALAYLILGLSYHVRAYREASLIQLLEKKAEQLSAFFDHSIDNDWVWFDNWVTYGNCRIPQALMAAGLALKKKELSDRGRKILDWLIQSQFKDHIFIPIGNAGWMTAQSKALFDQQPLEAHGMIDACLTAEKLAKNGHYADYAQQAFAWFTGGNICATQLYDSTSCGCRDGLHAAGANLNQGAESSLSWLMSYLRIAWYLRSKNK